MTEEKAGTGETATDGGDAPLPEEDFGAMFPSRVPPGTIFENNVHQNHPAREGPSSHGGLKHPLKHL